MSLHYLLSDTFIGPILSRSSQSIIVRHRIDRVVGAMNIGVVDGDLSKDCVSRVDPANVEGVGGCSLLNTGARAALFVVGRG